MYAAELFACCNRTLGIPNMPIIPPGCVFERVSRLKNYRCDILSCQISLNTNDIQYEIQTLSSENKFLECLYAMINSHDIDRDACQTNRMISHPQLHQ